MNGSRSSSSQATASTTSPVTMSYPGDTSLSAETQQRIEATFAQTRDLAAKGNVQEALLGCDFILRLDPQFEPARDLQSELQGGAPSSTSVSPEPQPEPAVPDEPPASETASPAEAEAEASAPAPEEPAVAVPEASVHSAEDSEPLAAAATDDGDVPEDPVVAPAEDDSHAEAETDAFVEGMFGSFQVPDEESGAGTSPGKEPSHLEPSSDAPAAVSVGLEMGEEQPDADTGAGEEEEEEEHDSQRRIRHLLSEGQEAFDRGEYQEAIDSWSRVFLIDIDHEEASQRIEEARKLKAESEREIEEIFHEGVGQFELGEYEAARATFEKVLEVHPHHLSAQEYLERIDEHEQADGMNAAADADEAPKPDLPLDLPADEMPAEDLPDTEIPELSAIDDVVATAEEAARPVVPARGAAVRSRSFDARTKFFVIGAAVLAVVLIAFWFIWDNRQLFFPQSGAENAARVAPETVDPIERARRLHERGKTAIAVAQLRRIPQDSVSYAEAQALIAQWESQGSPDAGQIALPSTADLEQQAELIASARAAYRNREFLRASDLFRQAAGIAPLEGTASALREDAELQIQSIRPEISTFRQGEWELVLPALWSMRETDPGNRDVQRLIIDSYYNLGVRDLQRGLPAAAAGKFGEALALEPDDEELQRLFVFAQTYESRGQDLLYRIFVKYLPFR